MKTADIVTGSVSTATQTDIVERGTGRESTGIGNEKPHGQIDMDRELHSDRQSERYSSQRDDGCRDYGGGGPRVDREHEEHRQDNDQRREFRRDADRGHRRGRRSCLCRFSDLIH